MDKFLVLYKAPNAVIDEWMKKPEQERKPDETKMMDAWKKWMSANASKFTDKGAGAGKPKVGNTAMGALAGAVVFGPIGLLAGGVVGYAAGEDIAHGMGLKRRHRHHHRRPARAVQRD